MLSFERVLAQLRHAYALAHADDDRAWTPAQRKRFTEGLLGPQIETLERLARSTEQLEENLTAAYVTNTRLRRRFTEVEELLLAKAHDIASASQARRIIVSVFHQVRQE
jgi:hypothetical protein